MPKESQLSKVDSKTMLFMQCVYAWIVYNKKSVDTNIVATDSGERKNIDNIPPSLGEEVLSNSHRECCSQNYYGGNSADELVQLSGF